MTAEDWQTIKKFREAGHAIVIFNPEELRGAERNHVENRLVELGWDVIDDLTKTPDPDYK